MNNEDKEAIPEKTIKGTNGKVLNLAYFRIKKELQNEGFDLVTGKNGKLTVILRVPGN